MPARPETAIGCITMYVSTTGNDTGHANRANGGHALSSFILNVTFDCADPPRLAQFWAAVTGYHPVTERADFVALEAPDHRGVRRLLFFRVAEPKVAKSRVHVDLAAKDPQVEIDRLVALGASKVEFRRGNGTSWTVMLDPEGNEFCLG
jgi:hypothetical protein